MLGLIRLFVVLMASICETTWAKGPAVSSNTVRTRNGDEWMDICGEPEHFQVGNVSRWIVHLLFTRFNQKVAPK